MRILICAATAAEAMACSRGVKDAPAGTVFEVLRTGMGLRNARKSLERELTKRRSTRNIGAAPMPDLIISAGFAGTFDSSVKLGSWVCSSKVLLWINPPTAEVSVVHEGVESGEVINRFMNLPRFKFLKTTSLSSPLLVAYDPALQKNLAGYGPIAVDMESASLGQVSAHFAIPFAVIRLVTDTPQKPLPAFVYNFAEAISRDARPAPQRRVHLFGKGAAQIMGNPVSVARFVANSLSWSKALESGWQKISMGALKS